MGDQRQGRTARLSLQRPPARFSIPELFVEFELHSPTQPDLRGVSAAGVPLVGIGHNDHLAWGFTSGLSDDDDLYVDKLDRPETYMFAGKDADRLPRRGLQPQRRATDLPDLIDNPGAPSAQ